MATLNEKWANAMHEWSTAKARVKECRKAEHAAIRHYNQDYELAIDTGGYAHLGRASRELAAAYDAKRAAELQLDMVNGDLILAEIGR